MKAEELMIGDWVKFPNGIEKIIDLPYIEGRGICASFAASATLFPVKVDELEPVPLTKEILEKNGFEKLDFSHYHINDRTLVLDADGTWEDTTWHWVVTEMSTNAKGHDVVLDYYVATINYVHELQHALKLCGIDKEIVL